MRALVFVAGVFLSTVLALGADADRESTPPPHVVTDHMQRLSLKMRAIRPLPPQPDTYLPMKFDSYNAGAGDASKTSAVNIGPLSARLGGTAKHAGLARYRFEGMDVLGGSVSGTLDTRGARIYLRWPPSGDE